MKPLIVDLDGTLIQTDMLHESTVAACAQQPLTVLRLPFWLQAGKARLKAELAQRVEVDAAVLPYHHDLIVWLKQQKADGRTVILCTASDKKIAEQIAVEVGLFDEVIASDGASNIAGANKADVLVERFGNKGFDYVGNSDADLPVWQVSDCSIVVNATDKVVAAAQALGNVEKIFPQQKIDVLMWAQMLRVHQWLKNLLIFIPLFTAHLLGDMSRLLPMTGAFIAFCLCASSVYIANDLMDLGSDRHHVRKRYRPFASGAVPIALGVVVAPLLLLLSLGIGSLINSAFVAVLLGYFILTCAYSLKLKQIVLLDCFVLAILYTVRIVAGAVAGDLQVTFWLLAVSVFLFLSLAFVKRYAELEIQVLKGTHKVHGRGYLTSDAPLLQTLGISAGYVAVAMLALYVNSDSVTRLYESPKVTWGAVPTLLFWVSWVWLRAHRGQMHDDPVIFAVKDKISLITGVCFVIFLLLGAVTW